MATTLKKNYGVSPAFDLTTIKVANIDYATDFRVERNDPKEAVLTSIQSPIGLAEKFRFAAQPISNIYANTTVDRALYAPSTKGLSVLVQLSEIWTLEDPEVPSFIQALPVEAHLVIRVPSNPNFSSSDIMTLIGRMLGGLFTHNAGQSNTRLAALLRQSLVPTA